MTSLISADCVYTPCFCEENAYKLCERLIQEPCELYVAFTSNRQRQVPLWRQRASSHPSGLVIWDYHVLVLQRTATECVVWDLDTTLPFPCSLSLYSEAGLNINLPLSPELARCWRVISADAYLNGFASDRSHMQLEDGSWQATPPTYQCIVASDGTRMRLDDYINVTDTPETSSASTAATLLGTVYSEAAFLKAFASQNTPISEEAAAAFSCP